MSDYREETKAHDKTIELVQKLQADNEKFRKAFHLIAAQCGLPDPADACRTILKTIKELEGGE